MTIYRWAIRLRHAGGIVEVHTTATSLEQARKQVCEWEGAPESAIIHTALIGRA